MKKFLTLLGICFCFSLFANERVVVTGISDCEYTNHESLYETWYDINYKNPRLVIWDLTFEEAVSSDQASGNRASKFTKFGSSVDQKIYSRSGYDKGHMCPNGDRDWSKESAEITFRMVNICPQSPKLNRGSWKQFESYGHKLAKNNMLVTIVCGPIYSETDKYIKNTVRIPSGFFKMFITENRVEYYIFNQDGYYYKTDLSQIEKVTNLKFSFPNK